MSDKEKRRRHGAGTVEKHGDLWRFRCPDGAGGRYTSPAEFVDDDAAADGLKRFRKLVATKQLVAIRGITLRDFWTTRFLPMTEKLRRAGTVGMYKRRWSRIGKAPFADKPIAAITKRDIRTWVNALPLTRPDAVLSALKAMLQIAVEDEIISANPASNIAVELAERDDDDLRPTPEEQEQLLACVAIPKPDRLIMMFALGAGLRPGEWRNLELADVHLDAKVPYVFVQFGSDERGKTKTGKKRRVPLLGMAPRALQAWLALLPTYAPRNPSGLVFPSASGERRDASSPFGRVGKKRESRWHKYLEQAGITRRLTPHSLRHGAATSLLTGERGTRLEAWQVQILLGHGRLSTTLKYLHAGEKDLFAALGNQSQNGPKPKPAEPKTGANPATYTDKTGMAEEIGFEPPSSSRLALVAHSQPENAPPGTVVGLIAVASAALRRLADGWRPTEAEAVALAEELRALREAADPVLVAAARAAEGGTFYLSALVELLDLAVPDAAADADVGRG